jgi:hypothetical protein
MSVKRFSVLGQDGVSVNTILVNCDALAGYWPGYGRYLVFNDEGDNPIIENSDVRPGFTHLAISPKSRIDIGNWMDVSTGAVLSVNTDLLPGDFAESAP